MSLAAATSSALRVSAERLEPPREALLQLAADRERA